MKKNRLLQKAALLCAAALALPFCLGAAPESAPGGGGDTVLVEPHIMLPGPDAPTPPPPLAPETIFPRLPTSSPSAVTHTSAIMLRKPARIAAKKAGMVFLGA